jgi:hypothetical protein
MLLFNCCKKQQEKLRKGYFDGQCGNRQRIWLNKIGCSLQEIAFCCDVAVQRYYSVLESGSFSGGNQFLHSRRLNSMDSQPGFSRGGFRGASPDSTTPAAVAGTATAPAVPATSATTSPATAIAPQAAAPAGGPAAAAAAVTATAVATNRRR